MSILVETLREAVAQHQRGELDSAELLYRKIVRLDPAHANALHLLGVLCCQRGDPRIGSDYIRRAIAFDDSAALFHMHLGMAYRAQEQTDDALECFRRAVEIDTSYAEAYFQLGICLEKRGESHLAITAFRNAVQHQPQNGNFHFRLGSALEASAQLTEAIASLKKAVQLRPTEANYHNSLGCALQKLGALSDAIQEYDEAARIRPDFGPYHFNLGNSHREQDRLEQALDHFRMALQLAPDDQEAQINLGVTLKELGRLDEALKWYDQLLIGNPGISAAHFNRSLVLLQQGNFARGWDEYEWRWDHGRCTKKSCQRMWDGSNLAGCSIFVLAEQGIGDEIMFASCLPDLLERTPKCIVECDHRLVPLFARSFPTATVVAKGDERKTPSPALQTDVQIPIGSLPRYSRRCLNDFPNRKSFLLADSDQLAIWHNRLSELGEGLKIGISWRGGKEPDVRRKRSTTLEQWSPILTLPGVHFVNLQYGDCSEELKWSGRQLNVNIHHWADADPLKNLDGLAAQIAALDLVISVDNATVHLAGALGRPVLVLLPFAGDWRWMQERNDTPWYPTVRLMRQPRPGDWTTLFEHLKEFLIRDYGKSLRNSLADPAWH